MQLVYCTYLRTEYTTGVFGVDAIIFPEDVGTRVSLATYNAHAYADLGDSSEAQDPSAVVYSGGIISLKDEGVLLPRYREEAKAVILELKDSWIADGAPTSILDAQGNPIVMDCDYSDKSNMEGLIMIMQKMGLTESQVRDHYNSSHLLTLAQIQQLLEDMIMYVAGTFYRKWDLRARVDAAGSKSEIEAVIGRPLA